MEIKWREQSFKTDWGKCKILRQESDHWSEDPKKVKVIRRQQGAQFARPTVGLVSEGEARSP